jgi:NAD(P) transhydrogenase subunit alpha
VSNPDILIIGASNLARSLAADSSALFARTLFNFLSAFWDKDQGRPVLPDDDEIVKGIRLTKDGKIVSERLAGSGA